jgi:ankyrin repeat protein
VLVLVLVQEGLTPLHVASHVDAAYVARVLLEHRAAVEAIDNQGRSPLHVACESNALNTIVLLLAEDSSLVDLRTRVCIHPCALAFSFSLSLFMHVLIPRCCGRLAMYLLQVHVEINTLVLQNAYYYVTPNSTC